MKRREEIMNSKGITSLDESSGESWGWRWKSGLSAWQGSVGAMVTVRSLGTTDPRKLV